MALQVGAEYCRYGLNLFLELQCSLVNVSFAGVFADEIDLQHGEVVGIEFVDERLFRRCRYFGAR